MLRSKFTQRAPKANLNHSFSPCDPKIQERAQKLLEEMVNIDSTTPDIDGVTRIQDIVARELKAIGFTIEKHPNPELKTAEIIIATLPGERSETVIFVSHADTVLPVNDVGPFRIEDNKGFGSGTIDNKGGLVVAIEGLRHFVQSLAGNKPSLTLKFVCSPNEEGGSTGFHEMFRACAANSLLVLGFEPALDNGSVIESRRGNRWYNIEVEGQEAHAGRCKGEQINAAHDIAIKIAKLHKLNDLKKGVSVNIGHLEGGRDRHNVVCGAIRAKLDARFSSFESRDKLHNKIDRILLRAKVSSSITGKDATTTYEIVDDCPPFSATSASRSLLRSYLKAVAKIEGRPVLSEKAGGAGDVNHMSRKGVIVLDGLGPIGGKMHTVKEFIYLPSLSTRALALSTFLGHSIPRLAKA